MSETAKGILAMTAACVIWGLSSMYYKLIAHVPPLEVLAHRTLWSLVFFGAVLALRGELRALVRLLTTGGRGLVSLAALAISLNWLMFIYAVQSGRAVEASLGYYIFPLVAVLFGLLFFGERLGPLKWSAVALAALAVLLLAFGLGAAPWISLGLATSFGFYGVVKKHLVAGPVVSVTAEVLLLAPLALLWLWGVHSQGWTGLTGQNLGAFGHGLTDSLLLILAGPITALPLMLFTQASKALPLGTLGVMQYINPTLQFAVAALVFAEPVTRWHWIALPLIWVAVALYSTDALRRDRSAASRSTRSGTSPATETKPRSVSAANP